MKQIISYTQQDQIRLECTIDLNKLFVTDAERQRFDRKWPAFLASDPYNKKVYKLKGNTLKYFSEQLIPKKTDSRPPLLLLFGNPASHSVDAGMFFSFEGSGQEHRLWKNILRPAGVIDLAQDVLLPVAERNKRRRQRLLQLDYSSPYRIGMAVIVSMPSGASDAWSGIAGIQKLISKRALARLEMEEKKRVLKDTKRFLGDSGRVVAFQKNAWNCLRSNDSLPYDMKLAKEGLLKGTVDGIPNVPLLGIPPTRLSGPASRILNQLLN